jgi:hypothetical protein
MVLNSHHLRCFCRRTWAVVIACFVMHAAAAAAGFDPANPASATTPDTTRPAFVETSSC